MDKANIMVDFRHFAIIMAYVAILSGLICGLSLRATNRTFAELSRHGVSSIGYSITVLNCLVVLAGV